MSRRTTQDHPPRVALLCPTSGTFDKIPGGTQWPGGEAFFISMKAHNECVKRLRDRIAELEANADPE